MCVFSVGSSPSEHSNMTFSTSIKAGSQNPGLLHSLSHTDVSHKDRIVCEHTTSLSFCTACSVSYMADVSQSESTLADHPHPFFPPYFWYRLLLAHLLCLHLVLPLSNPCYTGRPRTVQFLIGPHCTLVLCLLVISKRI